MKPAVFLSGFLSGLVAGWALSPNEAPHNASTIFTVTIPKPDFCPGAYTVAMSLTPFKEAPDVKFEPIMTPSWRAFIDETPGDVVGLVELSKSSPAIDSCAEFIVYTRENPTDVITLDFNAFVEGMPGMSKSNVNLNVHANCIEHYEFVEDVYDSPYTEKRTFAIQLNSASNPWVSLSPLFLSLVPFFI